MTYGSHSSPVFAQENGRPQVKLRTTVKLPSDDLWILGTGGISGPSVGINNQKMHQNSVLKFVQKLTGPDSPFALSHFELALPNLNRSQNTMTHYTVVLKIEVSEGEEIMRETCIFYG